MPDDSPTGKKFPGQKFPLVKTSEDLAVETAAQEPLASMEGAITIETYFAMAGVRDPVFQAGMRAYTKVRKAPFDEFKKIFATY